MAERLSDEAKRMCRMCSGKSPDGKCNIYNEVTQNALAETGECHQARISGPISWRPERRGEICGRMRRLEDGDWIFEGL